MRNYTGRIIVRTLLKCLTHHLVTVVSCSTPAHHRIRTLWWTQPLGEKFNAYFSSSTYFVCSNMYIEIKKTWFTLKGQFIIIIGFSLSWLLCLFLIKNELYSKIAQTDNDAIQNTPNYEDLSNLRLYIVSWHHKKDTNAC